MSRQTKMENFFRSKRCPTPSVPSSDELVKKPFKRKSLSLKKNATPTKSPKKAETNNVEHDGDDDEVIIVGSVGPMGELVDLTQLSDHSFHSQSTVCYSPTEDTQLFELPTPRSNRSSTNKTPQTGAKSLSAKSSSPIKNKFYSPTKKRMMNKPKPIRRALSFESTSTEYIRPSFNYFVSQEETTVNKKFMEACNDMDDKTIFLLKIIHKYLNDSTILHLLGEPEQNLLKESFNVVKPGMKLVSRLFWWKDRWYRMEKFYECKIEENDLPAILESLLAIGWITQANETNMTLDDYMEILKKDELKQICSNLKLKMGSKQDAVEALKSFSKKTNNITQYFLPSGSTNNNLQRLLGIMSKTGQFYKLSTLARTTLHKLYILMYLGMNYVYIREKTLDFQLINVKIKRQTFPIDPDVQLDSACVVFQRKQDFDSYVTALDMYEDFMSKKKPSEFEETQKFIKQVYSLYRDINTEDMARYKSLPSWLRRFTSPYVYVKLLENGVLELKRDSDSHSLLCLNILTTLIEQDHFRQHKKPDWYVEKSLIFDKLDRYDESAEVLLEGFKSNIPEEDKDFLHKRARILINRKSKRISETSKMELLKYVTDDLLENQFEGEHIYAQPMEPNGRGKLRFESRTPLAREVRSAEQQCLLTLLNTGEYIDGEHWEGKIVTTLFYLLFWDIIYSKTIKVYGAFLSYYQQFPLDLFTDDFYKNRKEAIDERLKLIATSTEDIILRLMHKTHISRPEYELSGISRDISWQQISGVVKCLYGACSNGSCTSGQCPGGDRLASLMRMCALAPQKARAGFPDLTLWNELTRKIKFVEVKTDNDKPSVKQLQWMHYLKTNGISSEFCYIGVQTRRQKSRNPKTPTKTGKIAKAKTPATKRKNTKKLPCDANTPAKNGELSCASEEKEIKIIGNGVMDGVEEFDTSSQDSDVKAKKEILSVFFSS